MSIWTTCGEAGDGPVLATAIHNGHELRPDVRKLHLLDEPTRLREEDPYTGPWAKLGDVSIIVHRSRFEMDLNRRMENAIYLEPADAWGLELWKHPLPDEAVQKSRNQYRVYYDMVHTLLEDMTSRWQRILVLDFHSYNHRRNGKAAEPEPQTQNPDINVGTHELDVQRWGGLIDTFIEKLCICSVNGERLDVRANVKFVGRQFPRWVVANFPNACALAIEVKKIFMDDWTGEPDRTAVDGSLKRSGKPSAD